MNRSRLGTRSTPEVIAETLRAAIADGSLAAGGQLHQEDLAARFGVSRSPLREALRQLEGEGLIRYEPNRGASVALLTRDEVAQTYEIRRILEAAAIRLAVPKLDDEVLGRARTIAQRLRTLEPDRQWARTHREFHMTLYEAAARPMLVELILRHYVRLDRMPARDVFLKRVARHAGADHRALLLACAARDADAAAAATVAHLQHMESVGLALLTD